MMASKLANGGDRLQALRSHVRALNAQFLSWVQEQAKNSLSEDWSDGVQDYLDYRKQILTEFADCIEDENLAGSVAPTSHAPAAQPAHPIFSFVAKPVTTSAPQFGAAPSATVPGLGSDKPIAPFGQEAATKFGAATSLSPLGTTNEGGEEDEEGASEAAQANYKPEVQADEASGTVLFKAKAKALVMNNKTWERKAAGLLTVRKPPNGRPFVTIGTDAGRRLLTATVPTNAKVLVNASQKVHGVYFSGAYTIPEGDAGQKAQQGNIMFQVAADKGADLKSQLEKVAAT